jgi:hypothetical protein
MHRVIHTHAQNNYKTDAFIYAHTLYQTSQLSAPSQLEEPQPLDETPLTYADSSVVLAQVSGIRNCACQVTPIVCDHAYT